MDVITLFHANDTYVFIWVFCLSRNFQLLFYNYYLEDLFLHSNNHEYAGWIRFQN